MKVRESGMPEEAYWESLFNVPLILDRLGIDSSLKDVFELGCGYGTFTFPVARRISGELITFDIEEGMVARARLRGAGEGVSNVTYVIRDVFSEGFGLEPGSQDAGLLFNILHGEEPVRVLSDAAQAVKPGGWLHVIHWRYDSSTPRGSSLDIRPRPQEILELVEKTGILKGEGAVIDLPPWHFGLKLRRLDKSGVKSRDEV